MDPAATKNTAIPRRFLRLFPLVLVLLSCQLVMQALQSSPALTSTPILSSSTPTITKSPTASITPAHTLTETSRPTPSAIQLQVFEQLWQVVNENYLYPDFNGLDWEVIHEEFRQRIEAGLTETDYYQTLAEMIDLLGDDHSVYLSPQQAAEVDAEYAGEYNYVGIGIMTKIVPERQRATIVCLFRNSPAEKAGLKIHDSILAVDGQPVVDESGFRSDLIRGPEGTAINLTVQTPGQAPRQVYIVRHQISGELPVPYELLNTPAKKRVGYILLPTFNDRTIDNQMKQVLISLSAQTPLEGLILDNRQNSGGMSDVFSGVLSYFTNGTVGHFIKRQQERPLSIDPINVEGSQKIPLVVLIGQNTASFGEIFSGILKDIGRAYLIGEQTDGNVEILNTYNFEDGSRAWIAEETFRPLNHPEEDWEQTGIFPDQIVPSEWDLVTLLTDPAVQAALAYFDDL